MKASGTKRSWRIGFDFDQPDPRKRRCDHPGCAGEGEYRAPKARDQLNQYYWFCLDHVRAYNSAWDYYKGMGPDEIENEIRHSTTWNRPTWPMGAKTAHRRFHFASDDPLSAFDQAGDDAAPRHPPSQTPEQTAMSMLDLKPPITIAILKRRYKELVKRHHPDANGGDKAAEERFKDINQAYHLLLRALTE